MTENDTECGRLREEAEQWERRCDRAYERFDAASNDAMQANLKLARLREQLDAARDTAETQRRIATIRENVEHIARGCRASTGHNPAPYLNSIEAALDALARAALGVEGEQEKPT